jgi:hypothetical protein
MASLHHWRGGGQVPNLRHPDPAARVQTVTYCKDTYTISTANGQTRKFWDKYVIRFPKGEMPPVRGFWSLTMYDAQWFFVANPLNRYTLSQRNALKSNPDGSVNLYIQAASPGPDKESNWLPAPSGPFILTLRLYWPKEHPPSIFDGTWKPPPVEKA